MVLKRENSSLKELFHVDDGVAQSSTVDVLNEGSQASSSKHQALLDDGFGCSFVLVSGQDVLHKVWVDGALGNGEALSGPSHELAGQYLSRVNGVRAGERGSFTGVPAEIRAAQRLLYTKREIHSYTSIRVVFQRREQFAENASVCVSQ